MDGYLKLQILVFIMCFLSSMTRHIMLESWSISKTHISDDLSFSSFMLGVIDTIFLFFYALGNIILGYVSDIYSPKLIMCASMLISSTMHSVVLLLTLYLYKQVAVYGIFIIINGFFQGSIWVCSISIMGNWFSVNNRGKVMGLWIVNSSLGNVLGSQIASGMIEGGVSWQLCLILILYLFVISLFLNLIFLKDKPEGQQKNHPKLKRVSFCHALKMPGVISYSIAFACVKMTHYSFVMWLPFYIYKQLEQSEYMGGVMASLYDIGGVFGCILLGWISDKISARVFLFFPLLVGSLPLILSFTLGSSETIWLFYLLIPIIGFIMGGVSNLICSAVASDLGEHSDEEYDAKSTVCGIIEGSGGFGAAFGQVIIGGIVRENWNNVFYFCFAATLMAVLSMIPIIAKAMKTKIKKDDGVEVKCE